MKLIQADSFDREGPEGNDKLIFYINSREIAEEVAKLLNDDCDDLECDVFFKAVPNDYKLKKFEA